jgi:hypothetical protein
MSVPRYPITLTPQERERLIQLIGTGKSSAYEQVGARVLLKADRSQGEPPADGEIAQAVEISRRTIIRIKKRFATEGLDAGAQIPQRATRAAQDQRESGGPSDRARLWPDAIRAPALDLTPVGGLHGATGLCRRDQL